MIDRGDDGQVSSAFLNSRLSTKYQRETSPDDRLSSINPAYHSPEKLNFREGKFDLRDLEQGLVSGSNDALRRKSAEFSSANRSGSQPVAGNFLPGLGPSELMDPKASEQFSHKLVPSFRSSAFAASFTDPPYWQQRLNKFGGTRLFDTPDGAAASEETDTLPVGSPGSKPDQSGDSTWRTQAPSEIMTLAAPTAVPELHPLGLGEGSEEAKSPPAATITTRQPLNSRPHPDTTSAGSVQHSYRRGSVRRAPVSESTKSRRPPFQQRIPPNSGSKSQPQPNRKEISTTNLFNLLAEDEDASAEDSEPEDASAETSTTPTASDEVATSKPPRVQDSGPQLTSHSRQSSIPQHLKRDKKAPHQYKLPKRPKDEKDSDTASKNDTIASTRIQEQKPDLIRASTQQGPDRKQGDASVNASQQEKPAAATRAQRRKNNGTIKADPITVIENTTSSSRPGKNLYGAPRKRSVTTSVPALEEDKSWGKTAIKVMIRLQKRPRDAPSSLWAILGEAWTLQDSAEPPVFSTTDLQTIFKEDLPEIKKVARLWRSGKVTSDYWAQASLSALNGYRDDRKTLLLELHASGHDMYHKEGCKRSATQSTDPSEGRESRCCAHPEGPIAVACGRPTYDSSGPMQRLIDSLFTSEQNPSPQPTRADPVTSSGPTKEKRAERSNSQEEKQKEFFDSSLFADWADVHEQGMGVSGLGDTSHFDAFWGPARQSILGAFKMEARDEITLKTMANGWLRPTVDDDAWTRIRQSGYSGLSSQGKKYLDTADRDTYHNRGCAGFAKDGTESICCAHPDALANSSAQISKKSSAGETREG